MRTSVRARRHEQSFLGGHMKARAQVNVRHHAKGALARAREQVNKPARANIRWARTNIHPHKKGARGRLLAHVCLHTKARARDDQAKFHLYTKGALARDRVDVRPHSREDSHFSVGDFGLQSDPQLGAWWQQ